MAKEKVSDLKKDLKKYSGLEALANSAGGKTLKKGLVRDIIAIVDRLGANYSTLTMQEFISHCAEMRTKKTLLDILINAPLNANGSETALEEYLTLNPEDRE